MGLSKISQVCQRMTYRVALQAVTGLGCNKNFIRSVRPLSDRFADYQTLTASQKRKTFGRCPGFSGNCAKPDNRYQADGKRRFTMLALRVAELRRPSGPGRGRVRSPGAKIRLECFCVSRQPTCQPTCQPSATYSVSRNRAMGLAPGYIQRCDEGLVGSVPA